MLTAAQAALIAPPKNTIPTPPSAQFIPYTTVEGDRWDTLAWRFYGDPTLIYPIVQTNPSVPITPVLPAGLSLGIPVIVIEANQQSTADLPPWRQS